MLEEDLICVSRGRLRWENKAEVVAERVEFLRWSGRLTSMDEKIDHRSGWADEK